MIDAIVEDVEQYYEINIRKFDLRPHKMQSTQLAKKVIYFCILHRFEILEKMKKEVNIKVKTRKREHST